MRRLREAAKILAGIVAKRLVEHLERAGFVVMQNRRRPALRARQ